ncbi:MAG: PP2C family protein-serine/threonine phosphatase [Planctomycetaceae bacterium]
MTGSAPPSADTPPPGTGPRPVVLLVDDQPIIGEAVRRMLAGDDAPAFHYCREPAAALDTAGALEPTVILLDLVMPELDGIELLRRFRAEERFRDVPIIVLSTKEDPAIKAEAFSLGASDYLVKLPDRVELLARIRHHSRGYTALVERNAAFEALRQSRELLAADIATAARYMRSLIPPPGPVGMLAADWRFVPSASLGGDAFGYHALDDDHVAIYLLDVCGHGVGAALLSVSVLSAVRAEVLPSTDFQTPESVLAALNRAFPMERHDGMFFTMWYGVYERQSRRLRWAGGGHPPAFLVPPPSPGQAPATIPLDSDGPLVGAIEGVEFSGSEVAVPPGSRLFVFSDGAFEIVRPGGGMWSLAEFRGFLASEAGAGGAAGAGLDHLLAHARGLAGHAPLLDDLSILAIDFPAGA